jgi:hypothetical protein
MIQLRADAMKAAESRTPFKTSDLRQRVSQPLSES